ncbi:MAG: class II fructose-1,6-bisphosphate aldolase [Patescibacteria group bacterium]|jgi:fructose-bisphosphate aldolase class II
MLTTLKKVLAKAHAGNYAVGAFNINNLEILQAVMQAAVEMRSPVIVQTSEGAVEYAGMEYLKAMVDVAAKADVPVVFHLDHGKNLDVVKKAIDSGYTSVMYDGSSLPDAENIANTKKVVGWAWWKGVSVEAELGAIAGIEDFVSVAEKDAHLTNPEKALAFVKATKCDALAIAVGTQHGAFKFKGETILDFDRISAIKKLVQMPLVLHGASGISPELVERTKTHCSILGDCARLDGAHGVSDEAIKEAVKRGINKINVDSDLRIAFTAAVRETLINDKTAIDPRKIVGPAKKLMTEVVKHKMELFGSAGKA